MSFQIHALSLVRYEASPKGTFPKKGYTYWDLESVAPSQSDSVAHPRRDGDMSDGWLRVILRKRWGPRIAELCSAK